MSIGKFPYVQQEEAQGEIIRIEKHGTEYEERDENF
jgi:hypothetical protein